MSVVNGVIRGIRRVDGAVFGNPGQPVVPELILGGEMFLQLSEVLVGTVGFHLRLYSACLLFQQEGVHLLHPFNH